MRNITILLAVSWSGVVAVGCGGAEVGSTAGDGGANADGSKTGNDGSVVTPADAGGDSQVVVVQDSGVPTTDGGVVVVGNPFPCGQGVCDPPEVCCESGGAAGVTTKCEDKSACTKGIAEGCTADTCPTGTVCCGSLNTGTAGLSGYTVCETSCPAGTDQLCDTAPGSQAPPCPTGDTCAALTLGGGRAVDVCRPPVTRPDGGVPPPFDGGVRPPPPDAGHD